MLHTWQDPAHLTRQLECPPCAAHPSRPSSMTAPVRCLSAIGYGSDGMNGSVVPVVPAASVEITPHLDLEEPADELTPFLPVPHEFLTPHPSSPMRCFV